MSITAVSSQLKYLSQRVIRLISNKLTAACLHCSSLDVVFLWVVMIAKFACAILTVIGTRWFCSL